MPDGTIIQARKNESSADCVAGGFMQLQPGNLKHMAEYSFEADFLIAGSGFAGSITAMILKRMGYSVCVVEKTEHPRFAIGESSTPIADMILRDFGDRYQLPFLKKLSRYGSWQEHYPGLLCGIKRGFSYYMHQPGEFPEGDSNHRNELLVAASTDNEQSDTNWYRSDVDHFLVKQARKLGVEIWEKTGVQHVERKENNTWNVFAKNDESTRRIACTWIIDATGSSAFSQEFFGAGSDSNGFETNSAALFSHFENAGLWNQYLEESGFYTQNYPYNPDYSALHHVLNEGWLWMLRFNNDLLSAGLVLDLDDEGLRQECGTEKWGRVISRYPALENLFAHTIFSGIPGRMIETGRLQRKLNKSFGEGWLALNHTAGFVDPFHSTGIAFALSGVEKIVRLFDPASGSKDIYSDLAAIQEQTCTELHFMDLLVSCCYKSRYHFELFTAAVMLYFAAAINYEQRRLKGSVPKTFLCAEERRLMEIVSISHHEIKEWKKHKNPHDAQKIIINIRQRIESCNSAGLMEPGKKNMHKHTAVEIP